MKREFLTLLIFLMLGFDSCNSIDDAIEPVQLDAQQEQIASDEEEPCRENCD